MKQCLQGLILLPTIFFVLACGSQTDSGLNDNVDPNDLSIKAVNIKKGMSREDVIGILGKPTWASVPGDLGDYGINDAKTGLILYWRNPGLAIVEVQFDTDIKARFDGGTPINSASYTHMFEPPAEYTCDNAERAKFCK